MRSVGLVLVLGLAACAARAQGPAWPKMAERDVDGGESLAPRQASIVAEATPAAADAKPDDDTDDAKPEAKADDATDDAEPTLGEPVIAPEEVINVDDIVIEIDDDD